MTKAKPLNVCRIPPLTDTALVLLSQASDREDGSLLPPPSSLKASGSAVRRVLSTLLRRGLVEEFACGDKEQIWRSEEEGGMGLRITRGGLAAIGVPALRETGSGSTEAKHDSKTCGEPVQEKTSAAGSIRPGSKQALLVEELRRPEGARIDDLVGTLGWLPHTVRAALTGLRKRGITIERDRDGEGATIYRTPPVAAKRQDKRRARSRVRAGAQS